MIKQSKIIEFQFKEIPDDKESRYGLGKAETIVPLEFLYVEESDSRMQNTE